MNTPRYASQGCKVVDTLLQRFSNRSDTFSASALAEALNSRIEVSEMSWQLPAGVARYYVAKNTNGQEIVVDRLEAKFLHMPNFEQLEYAYEILTGSRQWEDGCKHWYWEPLNGSALSKPSKGSDREPSFTVRFAVVSLWREGIEHSAIFDRKSKDIAVFEASPSELCWESVARACSKLNSASMKKWDFDWEASRYGDSITERPVSPTPKQQSFFYVFRENGDKPRVQHVSFELAQKEAERIAGTCDDRVFVLKAISVSKRQTKVNTQEMA